MDFRREPVSVVMLFSVVLMLLLTENDRGSRADDSVLNPLHRN